MNKGINKLLFESISNEKKLRESSGKTFADWFGEDLTGQTYEGFIRIPMRNTITSLKGAPKVVIGHFNVSNQQLDSLEGGPEKVTGTYTVSGCGLTSLKGAPEEVNYFICSGNKLETLEGGPKKVTGSYFCDYNRLTSLKGAPEEVGGTFDCTHNRLKSLEGGPKKVGEQYYAEHNDLESLEGLPKDIDPEEVYVDVQLKAKRFSKQQLPKEDLTEMIEAFAQDVRFLYEVYVNYHLGEKAYNILDALSKAVGIKTPFVNRRKNPKWEKNPKFEVNDMPEEFVEGIAQKIEDFKNKLNFYSNFELDNQLDDVIRYFVI